MYLIVLIERLRNKYNKILYSVPGTSDFTKAVGSFKR